MESIAEVLLVLVASLAAIFLAGYGLAARLRAIGTPERFAVAALAGLGWLLLNVSVVSAFKPLAGVWVWACLWPVGATLMDRQARAQLVRDVVELVRHVRVVTAILLIVGFEVLLLWPALSQPEVIYYDGSPNHDGFFWVSGAHYLAGHNYREALSEAAAYPSSYSSASIVGSSPAWGRMGAEGLLAVLAALTGRDPLQIYVAASAALFGPWLAAIFLTVRTFLVDKIPVTVVGGIVVLQPLFVFFHGNSNLPNLLGVLMGTAAVIATQRSLQSATERWPWLVLLALAGHGTLCAYPEILPFVALPAALLWFRAFLSPQTYPSRKFLTAPLLAAGLALLLNPFSTGRAWYGLKIAANMIRADQNWSNVFGLLSPFHYPAALLSLAPNATGKFSPWLSGILSSVLVLSFFYAIRRAKDPWGALLIVSGAGALWAYTLVTDFTYGWQKTVQFAAVFLAAILPVTALVVLGKGDGSGRWLRRSALILIVGFFAYATAFNVREMYRWAKTKTLTRDWYALQNFARQMRPGASFLIEGATFRPAFFLSMWSTYFLRDHPLYFAPRSDETGGYLRPKAAFEKYGSDPSPDAVLVSHAWAAAFDRNSPRWFEGSAFSVLRQANRILRWEGLEPSTGVPAAARNRIEASIVPHSAALFRLEIDWTENTPTRPPLNWQLTGKIDGTEVYASVIAGPPPWKLVVPLQPGKINEIAFVARDAPPDSRLAIRQIGIEAAD